MKDGPDFICIGAQKAGTTWLHHHLNCHPQTAMPPMKEVNFFYHLNFREKKTRLNKWLNPFKWRETWLMDKNNGDTRSPNQWLVYYLRWYKHYIFASRTVPQYLKLFPKVSGKQSGDVSPSYADLHESIIEQLSQHLPNTKIIYLLRNPIERSWSQFRMKSINLIKNKVIDNKLVQQIRVSSNMFGHSYYSKMLDRWERFFPGRVHVFFYDQIVENPHGLLSNICDYLGLDTATNNFKTDPNERIFQGPTYEIPYPIHQLLIERLQPEIEILHQRFGNAYTQKWLEQTLL